MNSRRMKKTEEQFTEHDLIMFRALAELLARGVRFDIAILSIVERYRANTDNHYIANAATLRSNSFTEAKEQPDIVMFATELLATIEATISERVKSEIAAATEQLSTKVDDVAEQIRIAKESTNEKLNMLLSRTETHGRCLPWWKFWKQ